MSPDASIAPAELSGAEPSSDFARASNGRAALECWAPQVSGILDTLEGAMWRTMAGSGREDWIDLAARVVAGQHGLKALARPPELGASPWSDDQAARWRMIEELAEDQRVALRFAEQMSFDVASLQDEERQEAFDRLGDFAGVFAQAVFVADLVPRAWHALDAIFGARDESSWSGTSSPATSLDLPQAIECLIRDIPQLQALDAVTTELVRLLGARRHRCRICQSVRSRSALAAGANEATFDAVDRHASSDLDDAQKAALAFTEAFVSTPGRIDADTVRALRAHFGPAACVELVLDVTRNATNKVAVALETDTPNVERGYEIYEVMPSGEILYGLEAP
jgi:alkylhydroperoxidase family enzyme